MLFVHRFFVAFLHTFRSRNKYKKNIPPRGDLKHVEHHADYIVVRIPKITSSLYWHCIDEEVDVQKMD